MARKPISDGSDCAAPLTVAVVGYGKFGRLHSIKYRELPDTELSCIVDSCPERRALAQQEHPTVRTFESVGQMLAGQRPDIASVVVPAAEHFEVARELLARGVHILVEKPL